MNNTLPTVASAMSAIARVKEVACGLSLATLFCGWSPLVLGTTQALTPEQEFARARQVLKKQSENLRSVYLKFVWTQETTPEDARRSGFPWTIHKRTCICLRSGGKVRGEEELRFGDAEEVAYKEVRTYDGKEHRSYLPAIKKGSIASKTALPWSLFELAYPALKSGDVAGFLEEHRGEIQASSALDSQGRRLLQLELSVRNRRVRICLDPEANYLPRTVLTRGTVPSETVKTTGVERGESRTEVLEFRQVGAFSFPARVKRVHTAFMVNGQAKRLVAHTIELKEAKVNIPIDERQFAIEFPLGTQVTLYDSKTSYIVGGPFDQEAKLRPATPAPELKNLEWLQREWKGFEAATGKHVVVAFVSIKNRPSRKVIADLQEAVAKAKKDKLQAILIHDASATAEQIKEYLEKNKITLPVARVTQEEHQGWYSPAFRAYQVSSVPTVVLIGPDGKMLSGNVPIGELKRKLSSALE